MKSYKIHKTLLAFLLTAMAGNVSAETFSYTFISGSYEMFNEDIDGISEDLEGDGINLDMSVNLAPNVALIASYGAHNADVESDSITIDGDIKTTSFGAAFHTPVDDQVDFVAGAQLIRGSVELTINNSHQSTADADGNAIFAGVRAMVISNVELNGFVSRTKIEDDSSTDISFGAAYYINNLLSVDAGYSFDSDANSVKFGVTKHF